MVSPPTNTILLRAPVSEMTRLQRVHRRIDLRHRHGTGFGADSLGFRIGQCAAPCGDVIDNAGELLRAAGAVGPADRAAVAVFTVIAPGTFS